jgi:hypothetical protein
LGLLPERRTGLAFDYSDSPAFAGQDLNRLGATFAGQDWQLSGSNAGQAIFPGRRLTLSKRKADLCYEALNNF